MRAAAKGTLETFNSGPIIDPFEASAKYYHERTLDNGNHIADNECHQYYVNLFWLGDENSRNEEDDEGQSDTSKNSDIRPPENASSTVKAKENRKQNRSV